METVSNKPAPPQQGRFTVEEYHRMGAAGILDEDDRIELLDGYICVMSPIGSQDAACVRRLTRLFIQRAEPQALVSTQNPIFLNPESEPEPDVALLAPRQDDYSTRHRRPNEVMLVVEVADTSIRLDRDVKLPLDARADIPELWIVALEHDRIHVYREPEADRCEEHDRLKPDDKVAVAALPSLASFSVDAILGE